METWYIGTMGFAYKDWVGPFYPDGMAARDFLAYYSRVFNAVEIDSTFYGVPRASTVQQWLVSTPPDFHFCLKMPRAVTHELGSPGALSLADEFCRAVRGLGEKLGVTLLQFPPSFTVEQFPILEGFLTRLPEDLHFAVEIRHSSWFKDAESLEKLLAPVGVAWAATEYPGLPRQVHNTASYLYLRWIGQHGSFTRHTHERIDRAAQLAEWLGLIEPRLVQVQAVYGFMNNDFAGFAAGSANKFKEIAGLPVIPLKPAEQKRLF